MLVCYISDFLILYNFLYCDNFVVLKGKLTNNSFNTIFLIIEDTKRAFVVYTRQIGLFFIIKPFRFLSTPAKKKQRWLQLWKKIQSKKF